MGWVEGFEGEVVAEGKRFLVKSKLAVARFAERAIAKVAIALFPKCATTIPM